MTNLTKEERQQIFETNFNKYKTSCYGHFSSIEFLNKYKNVILNFINKDNIGKFDIFLMTNKDSLGISKDKLNRNKHLGAQFCAVSAHNITYYYFTQAIWQDNTGNYLSLNADQCNLIKRNTTDSFKAVLINTGKLYVFENFSEDIVDGHKVPVEYAVKSYEICKADFRKPILGSTIKVGALGGVRYKSMIGNKLHAKQLTIIAPEYRYKRTFKSIVDAYASLTGTKIVNGKIEGKPVSNAAYAKSYVTFRRDIKSNTLHLINEKGETFPVSIVTESVGIRKDDHNTIIDLIKSNNNSVVVTSDNKNCNKSKSGRRSLDKNIDKLTNKQMDKLANILADNISAPSEQEIKETVIKYGNNFGMLSAYVDSLNERGFVKEALYAAKLFAALNSITLN